MTAGALRGIGEMSPERFAEHYMDIGEREGVLLDPKFDPEAFVVTDEGHEHELAHLYERFLALPARSRRYFLLRALRGAGVTPFIAAPSYADVRDRIMPRLRSGAYLDIAQLDDDNRGRPPQQSYAAIAGELYVSVVIDSDEAMAPVTRGMLAQWNLTLEEVRGDALENLAKVDPEPLGMLSPGFWMGPWDDAYAASRLLDLDILRVCDEPIIAVPNRDTLLVADRTNPSALAALVSLIENVAECGYALSRGLLRLDGDLLHLWSLPTTHPSSQQHRRLCVSERARQYSEQQWVLQEAAGDDCYVATAEIDEAKDGSLSSRALWTEGVSALLPEVDRLHLLSAMADGTSSRLVVAEFADICDLDGVVERTQNLLPRWRTLRFPTDAELSRVAAPVVRDPGTASLSDPGSRP
jgi:hypothetical protein